MRIKKSELIYFFAIILLLIRYTLQVSTLINVSSSSSFFDILLIISYLLLFLKIIYKESIRNLIIYAIIILFAIISYVNSKMTDYLTLVLVVIATKNIEIKKIVKFLFEYYLIILIVHIIAYVLMMLLDSSSIHVIQRDTISRYSFFLGHPNTFAALIAWTNIMYLYLKYEKINKLDYIGSFLVAIFIFFVPNSRTSALLLILTIILIVIFKSNKRKLINIFKFALPIISITMFIILFNNDQIDFISKLDSFFNARIRLAIAIYENFGIAMFGVYVPFGEELKILYKYGLTQLTVDSTYYSLLFSYGIVNTIIFLLVYTRICLKKQTESKIILFLVIWSIYAITETLALSPILCFPLLFATELIEKRKRVKKNES